MNPQVGKDKNNKLGLPNLTNRNGEDPINIYSWEHSFLTQQ